MTRAFCLWRAGYWRRRWMASGYCDALAMVAMHRWQRAADTL